MKRQPIAFIVLMFLVLDLCVCDAQSSDLKNLVNGATLDDAEAQYRLSIELMPEFPRASNIWLRRAATNGYERAQVNLAEKLILGQKEQRSEAATNQAIYWFRQAADKDYVPALRALGYMYSKSPLVPTDYEKAASWYSRAAWLNDPNSQYSLGRMYLAGEGVAKDVENAVSWIRKSAEQEYVSAQLLMGSLYFGGELVEQDYAEATRWFEKAAQRGNAHAQYSYGFMLAQGNGVDRDIAEAVKWFKDSAEQGYGPGQLAYGESYLRGKGVPQDLVQAYKWLDLATRTDVPGAQKLRDLAAQNMTAPQVAQATDLARNWRPRRNAKQ